MVDVEATGSLLVLAAFEPELAPLRVELAGRTGAHGRGSQGELEGGPLSLATCGIGVVDAALGAAEALRRGAFRAVVLVGTAGAYPGSGLALGSVVVARSSRLADAGAARGEAAFVAHTAATVLPDPGLVHAFTAKGAIPADVRTTLTVTTSDALAVDLARGETPAVEHLEAHAVARAAAQAGVPWVAVLGIANVVGARGRDEWRAHNAEASRAVARVVAAWSRG